MRRPRLAPTLSLVLASILAAVPVLPALAAEEKEVESAYSKAEGTDADLLFELSEAALEADYDTSRAAKVESFVLERDTGKLTLDGHVFLKDPIKGVVTDAMFFGKGKLRIEPPIAMERQQVQRYLGTEEIDVPITRADITFIDHATEKRFKDLAYSEELAAKVLEENDAAEQWAEEVHERRTRPVESEEEQRRKLQAAAVARDVYQRLINPHEEHELGIMVWVDVPDDVDKSRTYLDRVAWQYEPLTAEEVGVFGRFNEGRDEYWVRLAQFATSDQYRGRYKYAGTSSKLERKDVNLAAAHSNQLVMRFDPGGKHDVHMASEIDYEFRLRPRPTVTLNVSPWLETISAKVDGKEMQFIQPEIPGPRPLWSPVITIPLARSYEPGERVKVELELRGNLLRSHDGSTWIIRDTDNWYPDVGGREQLTSFDITMVMPKKFVGVAIGKQEECAPEHAAEGGECARFVTTRPVAMATFSLGRGIRIDEDVALDGTPVRSYTNTDTKMDVTVPGAAGRPITKAYNLSKMSPAVVQKAKAALAIFEHWFGEYPYAKLALMPNPSGTGRGFPSLLLLWNLAYLSPVDWAELGRTQDPWWVDAFVSHETAHQWWGHVAGIRSSRDQWFSEGFADYASIIYLEAVDQTRDTDWKMRQLEDWHDALTVDDGYLHTLTPLTLANYIDSRHNRAPYDRRSVRQTYMYNKGGFVMHMLRTHARYLKGSDEAGDELFKTAWRNFLDQVYGGFPSNLDMQKSLSASYRTDLSWFFKQWVHGLGLPKIRFAHQLEKHPDGGWLLRGRVVQADTDFKFALPVFLHETSKVEDGTESPHFYQWIDEADQTFEVGPIPRKPAKVTINDDYGLLCTWEQVEWTELPPPAAVTGQ